MRKKIKHIFEKTKQTPLKPLIMYKVEEGACTYSPQKLYYKAIQDLHEIL